MLKITGFWTLNRGRMLVVGMVFLLSWIEWCWVTLILVDRENLAHLEVKAEPNAD